VAVQCEIPSDNQTTSDDDSTHLEATVVKHVYHKDLSEVWYSCVEVLYITNKYVYKNQLSIMTIVLKQA